MFPFSLFGAFGMAKVILHTDLNNCCASVACRTGLICGRRPWRHGIVPAKNTPARRYGIQTGQAFQPCPNLSTIAPDYREGSRMSQVFHAIFGRCADRVQPLASPMPGWTARRTTAAPVTATTPSGGDRKRERQTVWFPARTEPANSFGRKEESGNPNR